MKTDVPFVGWFGEWVCGCSYCRKFLIVPSGKFKVDDFLVEKLANGSHLFFLLTKSLKLPFGVISDDYGVINPEFVGVVTECRFVCLFLCFSSFFFVGECKGVDGGRARETKS